MQVHPLMFEPIFKPKIWGGRHLETVFNKALPPGVNIGESWEAADLENDQSVVTVGRAKGKTLGELVSLWGEELIGRAELFEGRFPLLIKFLDASQNLSVQVHPDAKMAAKLGGNVRVKNEAWYVLSAGPQGAIYRGLNPGVTRESFAQAIRDGTCDQLLKRIPVKEGDCYYLPSGTVHALGADVMVAEIQNPSDVTYRVFDWNRVDESTGKPRELHVDLALECINFDTPPPDQRRSHVASVWTAVTRLATCESFVIEKVRMAEGLVQEIPYAELVVWMVLEGRGRILCGDGPAVEFKKGDTVVLPAGMKNGRVEMLADGVWLEVTIPTEGNPDGCRTVDRAALPATGTSVLHD